MREKFERLLEADPGDAFLRYSLALELAKTDEAAALKQFDRVLEQHPDYVPAYFMKGRTLARGDRDEEARETLPGRRRGGHPHRRHPRRRRDERLPGGPRMSGGASDRGAELVPPGLLDTLRTLAEEQEKPGWGRPRPRVRGRVGRDGRRPACPAG